MLTVSTKHRTARQRAGGKILHRARPLVASLALAVIVLPAASLAQPSPLVEPRPAATAHDFSIPAQALASALTAFGQQSGLQISVEANLVRDLPARALNGSWTADQALRQLLAGRLTYRFLDDQTILIEPLSATQAGVMTLGPVRIEAHGSRESAVAGHAGDDDGAVTPSTGTMTDTPAIEVPQAVTVLTRQQMTDQGAQTVDQALRYALGVVSEAHGTLDDESDFLLLRGFGGANNNEYLDVMKLVNGGIITPQLDLYNLDRIEIVKGPASVVYGQNDPGGVVNLISKRPTDTPFETIEGQLGSYGRKEGSFDFGGPVESDGTLLYRLTGLALTSDTQTDYVKEQRSFIAPAVTWQPSADASWTMLGSYQHDPQGAVGNPVPAIGTVLPNPNGQISTSFFEGDPSFNTSIRTQYSVTSLFTDHLDSHWTMRLNARYLHASQTQGYLLNEGFELDEATLDRITFLSRDRLDEVAVDSQLQAKYMIGPIQYTGLVGVSYLHSFDSYQLSYGRNSPLNAFAPVYSLAAEPANVAAQDYQQLVQYGALMQNQIEWDRWALALDGRLDWAGASTKDDVYGGTDSQFSRVFTKRIGLTYLFDCGLVPYLSYSTSFLPTSGTNYQNKQFVPVTGTQEEFGIKYQPAGLDSFLTVALYNLTEQHVLTDDPVNPGFQVQAGEVRSRGFEVGGTLRLLDNLSLTGAFAYTDAVNTRSTSYDFGVDGQYYAIQGKDPVAIPRNLASLWADYRLHEDWTRGLGFGFGARFTGSTYGDDVNSFKVRSFTLYDAALYYDMAALGTLFDGFKLQLNASNLLDKTYVASCQDQWDCYFGPRRTVYATVGYSW